MDSGVRNTFDALLTDLQNTTAVLKRANLNRNGDVDPELEPVYEVQRVRMTTATTNTSEQSTSAGLHDLDRLMDDFSSQRGQKKPQRPTVESLFNELDSIVANGEATDSTVRSARSTTRNLDNLMDSLSDLKLRHDVQHQHQNVQHHQNSAYSQPQKAKTLMSTQQKNAVDMTLNNIEVDMNRHGINTIPKGDCAACHKSIVGQVVIALGKMWHPEHFTCAHCGNELGQENFFERSGKAYCENDYHNLFSPRCAYCNGPIKDKCVTALDKTWHPEHFFCAQCGKHFGDDGFHERSGQPYCREDYFNMFAPRCEGCKRPITNNYITALKAQWHPECFVCKQCKQPFGGGSFFDHDGAPYCETHYHEKRGSLCAACLKPISGRCVTAMGRKFHPEHFVCSFCLRQLNKGTFKEHDNKPYCHQCFNKLLS